MKTAPKFYKAYSFMVSGLLSVFLFAQTIFELFNPEIFGEIGSLGYAFVLAGIAFLRALSQKNMEEKPKQ